METTNARPLYRHDRVRGAKVLRTLGTIMDKRRALREVRKVAKAVGVNRQGVHLHTTAIDGFVIWQETPQGHDFWQALFEKSYGLRR